MKCFYAKGTEAHDPQFRLYLGTMARNAEQAERARLLLAGLDRLDGTQGQPSALEHPARGRLVAAHDVRHRNRREPDVVDVDVATVA